MYLEWKLIDHHSVRNMRSPQAEATQDLKFIQASSSTSAVFFPNLAVFFKFIKECCNNILYFQHAIHIFQFGSETMVRSSTTLKHEYAYNEGNQRNVFKTVLLKAASQRRVWRFSP
jgi:hypothetical protein